MHEHARRDVQIAQLLRELADVVEATKEPPRMPVIYSDAVHTARTLAVRNAVDAGGAPGRLEFLADDGVTVLSSIALGYPGDATAAVDVRTLTFVGFPRSDAEVDVSGTPASARIVDANRAPVISGLRLGVPGDGTDPDIELDRLTLYAGETLRINSARVGPVAPPPPDPVVIPVLSAPVITVTGATTASVAVTTDTANGTLYCLVSANPTEPVSAVKNGTALAVTVAGAQTVAVTGLAPSSAYFAHFVHTSAAGADSTRLSSGVFNTPAAADTADPVLSGPVVAATGATTATLGVTADEGNGRLYVVVTPNATAPTAAQIRAGQDSTGGAAAFAANQLLSSAGIKSFNAAGLAASTAYHAYFHQRDAAGNDSLVLSAGGFTTAALPPVEPPPTYTDVLPTILSDVDKDGPTQTFWSSHLYQTWKNRMGDWTDATGAPQGSVPFSSLVITALGEYVLDVTEIVKSGQPIVLRASGKNSPSARFAGRGSLTPPRIVALNAAGGNVPVSVLAYSCWNSSTSSALDTYAQGSVSTIANAAVSYSAGPGVESAFLHLTCNLKSTANATVGTFKCDAPPCRIAGGGGAPLLGLAAEAGSEVALQGHPDVFLACDFSDPEDDFNGYAYGASTVPEYLDDPDSPGRKIVRNKFVPGSNGSMNFSLQLTKPNLTDPRRPILSSPKEFYQRMYVFLEDDWADVHQDGQKAGIGIDQRFGWWSDSGGYWQNTTGNGGIIGTGLKILRPAGYGNGPKDTEYWEYQGHSQRMEFARGPVDPAHPYRMYRPIQFYAYHMDQPDFNGQLFTGQGVCMPIGRWVCIEVFTKTNSIDLTGADAIGNGTALYDGVIRVWVDGVLAMDKSNLRFRRHPDMGLEGPWGVWYYGGKTFPPHPMHYRMKDFVCASRYIGPKA